MRLIMMGTGPFAVPTFESLLNSEHDVAALITRPVPPPKGRRKSPPNPMRDAAERHQLPTLDPQDVNDDESRKQIAAFEPELLVVCDYGQILSRETLGIAPLGGINLHGSLLPRYRGAAPIQWALLNGEEETGVSVIHMTPRLDAGPCLVVKKLKIDSEETGFELEGRLSELGIGAVMESIQMLANWDRQSDIGEIQDQQLASRAPRLRKEQGEVDWSKTAVQIKNQVRALKPWPTTFTFWKRQSGEPLRIILDRVSVVSEESNDHRPGEIIAGDANQLHVATGSGVLSIEQIQPSGKRVLEIQEFLRGYPLRAGDVLGK